MFKKEGIVMLIEKIKLLEFEEYSIQELNVLEYIIVIEKIMLWKEEYDGEYILLWH